VDNQQYNSYSVRIETIAIPFRSKLWIRPKKIFQFKRGREVYFDWGLDWVESAGVAMISEVDGISSVFSCVVPNSLDPLFKKALCEKIPLREVWRSEELMFEKKLQFYPSSFKSHRSKTAEMTDVYLHLASGLIGRRVYRSGRIGIIPNELTTEVGLADFKEQIKNNLSEIWGRIDAAKNAEQSA
jgi:hypothetical protein